jgi:hypothetical protein
MKYVITISVSKTDKDGGVSTHSQEIERSLINLAFDEAEAVLGDMRHYAESEEKKENNIIEE